MVKIIGTGEHYTNVANTLVNDKRLSWKAKGIFLYLWSQSGNWHFYQNEIKNHATDGPAALRSGIAELTKYNYLRRVNTKKADGTFDGVAWLLNDRGQVSDYTDSGEIKQNPKKMCDFPQSGESAKRKVRKAENRTLTITNSNYYQNKQLSKETNKEEHTGGVQAPAKPPKKKKKRIEIEPRTKEVANEIIPYLNSKTGGDYHTTTESYLVLIQGRLHSELHPTVEDFKTVIDYKVKKWLHDPKMVDFLRPATLFAPSHFGDYLSQARMAKKAARDNGTDESFEEMAKETEKRMAKYADDDLPF